MAVNDQAQGERGVSLVGTLVVLMIMSGLVLLVVSAWPSDPSGTSATLRQLTSEANPAGGGSSGGATGAPRSPTADAGTAACTANVRSLEQAMATMHASTGTFPATVGELVAAGWISEAPASPGYALTMAEADGRANGRILVNDLPSDQGCAAPRRAGP